MEAFLYLLPLAVFIGLIFVGAFYWAWKSGQFDDIEGPAHRIIFQDDDAPDLPKRKEGEGDSVN